jgi:hypothetical protein
VSLKVVKQYIENQIRIPGASALGVRQKNVRCRRRGMEGKKEHYVDWFCSTVRVMGASVPGTASLLRIQDEIATKQMDERISRLEDPISHLHEDVRKVSKDIFDKMVELDSDVLEFDEEFYERYNRVLTILDSRGLLKREGPPHISLTDPGYILYLCRLFADQASMETLYETIDSCPPGEAFSSQGLQEQLHLPLPSIEAMFKVFEAKGLGWVNECTGGFTEYIGTA